MEKLLEEDEEDLEQYVEELSLEKVGQPDILYTKKDNNCRGSRYEPGQISETLDGIEDYLEDIQLDSISDVEEIALDLENGRAVMYDGDGQEVYEKIVENEDKTFYKAHVYGREEPALVERKNFLTRVHTCNGEEFKADQTVENRLTLFEQVCSEVDRAGKRKELDEKGGRYSFRMGASMSEMLQRLDGASEMKFRNKMEDTLVDLSLEGVGDVDSFSEYAGDVNKWSKWSTDNRFIYMSVGDYRFYTVDGSEIDTLDDNVVYGVAASTAKKKGTGLNQNRVMNLLFNQDSEGLEDIIENGVSL